MRHIASACLGLLALIGTALAETPMATTVAFHRWIESLWPDAQKLGVSRVIFDSATRNLEPDLTLPDLVVPGRPQQAPEQPEFALTPADYLREVSFTRFAEQGRRLRERNGATLAAIEREFGVPSSIVLAIWARETSYGTAPLRYSAVRVLATQGFLGARKDKFREEFLLALKMIGDEHLKPDDLKSSWAGAMGQTQFLPSDFFKYAVDFDHDGRRDIWNSIPDTLASAAKQLSGKGWQRGERWAYEVRVPPRFDCTSANPDAPLQIREWLRRGLMLAHSVKFSEADLDKKMALLLPAGMYGPGFLITANYFVIKEYNFSDLYALFVGHLADRIEGGTPFETPWAPVVQLSGSQLAAMQQRLTKLGLYADKIDGKAGMKTRLALGAYQKANGLKLDCWPTKEVVESLLR